jgi:hypothetical protein
MRAVEQEFHGWHVWASDSGHIWAATAENHAGGSGTTLDAPTPALMRQKIADQVRCWARAA